MTEHENDEVKDFVERIEVTPSDDDELVDEAEETAADSSSDEANDDEVTNDSDENRKDELVTQKTEPAKEIIKDEDSNNLIKEVPGETPRERALRRELTRLKREKAGERKSELGITDPIPKNNVVAKKELSPEKAKVLSRYKPEDIENLKELMDVMADDIGFVRKDQLGASTYADKANEVLEGFLEKHPEYLPENDHDNVMWNEFKAGYALYKQPANPKDFAKIFERVHRDVFGIQPAGADKKTDATREKVKVASHAGASKPATSSRQSSAPSGLRTDMLKGFSDEEIAEITG